MGKTIHDPVEGFGNVFSNTCLIRHRLGHDLKDYKSQRSQHKWIYNTRRVNLYGVKWLLICLYSLLSRNDWTLPFSYLLCLYTGIVIINCQHLIFNLTALHAYQLVESNGIIHTKSKCSKLLITNSQLANVRSTFRNLQGVNILLRREKDFRGLNQPNACDQPFCAANSGL